MTLTTGNMQRQCLWQCEQGFCLPHTKKIPVCVNLSDQHKDANTDIYRNLRVRTIINQSLKRPIYIFHISAFLYASLFLFLLPLIYFRFFINIILTIIWSWVFSAPKHFNMTHLSGSRPWPHLFISLWWLFLSLSINAKLHLVHTFEHVFYVYECRWVCVCVPSNPLLFVIVCYEATVLKMSLRFWLSLHLNGLLCKCAMGCYLKCLLNREIACCICMWGREAVENTVYVKKQPQCHKLASDNWVISSEKNIKPNQMGYDVKMLSFKKKKHSEKLWVCFCLFFALFIKQNCMTGFSVCVCVCVYSFAFTVFFIFVT